MPRPATASESALRAARRLTVTGFVQGLGVRPSVARLALECGVAGSVSNRLSGIQIEIEGPPSQIDQFQELLPRRLPAAARIDAIETTAIPVAGRPAFVIEEAAATGIVATQVPRDLAACPECLQETGRASDRRYRYPFTSCTNCGPRYSIVDTMPFERSRSAMARFPLCPACRAEYTDPADRRFHAQTTCCPDCGPQIWCCDCARQVVARRDEALRSAVDALRQGLIVAVRGVGGYQLVCDATSTAAVERLRARKQRRSKPLAIMAADLAAAERLAEVDAVARAALLDPANPIVLLPVRLECDLAAGVHPGLDCVGVMLPTTPLHWLLLQDCGRPLVVTSGNREGEPMAVEVDDAHVLLAEVADLWLHHDRPIIRAIDDSVVRVIAGRAVTIRLARGLAPLPLALPFVDPALAAGGQQKAALALCNGSQSILGPHIGELDSPRNRERFLSEARHSLALYGVTGPLRLHDLHPDYFSTRWVHDQPGRRDPVQHHHAHVAAGMLEHGWLDREVLGVAFDGTGYGPDGTIWGGEFLHATDRAFRRVAQLREFPLAGGEAAIREPWRVALALVQQALGDEAALSLFSGSRRESAARLRLVLERPQMSPRTSSAGRLFDGVAALVLEIERSDFEGFPAMQLESAAQPTDEPGYHFSLEEGDPLQLDWRPMVVDLLADLRRGAAPGAMAMRFHRGLAAAAAAVCRRFAPLPVVLSGGVFQNRLLTELLVEGLAGSNQPVGLPGRIPPNDGGLAAGQLAVGLARHREGGPAACV